MGDPKWAEIFSRTVVEERPGASRLILPTVVGSPTCEAHCNGGHVAEAVIQCPKCRTQAAVIIRHRWAHDPGHYFSTVEPRNGYRIGDPNRCRDCQTDFEREETGR